MKSRIFSVRDVKAGAYLQPFYSVNTETALRSFKFTAEDSKHDFNRFASDYQLYELGEYDDVSGNVSSLAQPHYIACAADFVSTAPVNRMTSVQNNDDAVKIS